MDTPSAMPMQSRYRARRSENSALISEAEQHPRSLDLLQLNASSPGRAPPSLRASPTRYIVMAYTRYRPMFDASPADHTYVGHKYAGHDYVGHNCVGRNYVGRNYVGHKYAGHKYADHDYVGHNCVGHNYADHNYIGLHSYGPI